MGIALAGSFASMGKMAIHFGWFSRCSDQPQGSLHVNGQSKDDIKTLDAPRSPRDRCHRAHSSMGDRDSVREAIAPATALWCSFHDRHVHWSYVDGNLEGS